MLKEKGVAEAGRALSAPELRISGNNHHTVTVTLAAPGQFDTMRRTNTGALRGPSRGHLGGQQAVHRPGSGESRVARTLTRISVVPVVMGGRVSERCAEIARMIGASAFLQTTEPVDIRSLSKRTLGGSGGEVVLLDGRHTRPSVVYRAIVRARSAGWERGIVLLLGAGDLSMVPVASSIGVTDFVLSSASAEEIEARLRRAAGETLAAPAQRREEPAAIELHWPSHQISFEGTSVSLTLREMQLLAVLIDRQGSIITAGDLSREAWGKGRQTGGALITAYVCSLRKKLAWFGGRFGIQTVRGVGYQFVM